MDTTVGQDRPSPGEAWTDLDLIPTAPVRELFQALDKALRAHRLYDENNPVYIRFLTSLQEALAAVWRDTETLQIQVHEYRLLFMGEEVYKSTERSDSLSFMFWKDGIREIVMERGLEGEELPLLLDALQRSRNLAAEGDDLLTILWETELQHFRYGYVDLLAEGVVTPEAGDTSQVDLAGILDGELGTELSAGEEPQPDQIQPSVSADDFNPTLYSLGPAEMEYLRTEVSREVNRDLRADLLSALFDRLEEPEHPERQQEILEVLRSLLPNLLSRGALTSVGEIMQELEWIASQARHAPGRIGGVRHGRHRRDEPGVVSGRARSVPEGRVDRSPHGGVDPLPAVPAARSATGPAQAGPGERRNAPPGAP